MTNPPDPLFRAPKGTPNFNAFRTLQLGVVCALAILLLTDPIMRAWDVAGRAVPWVSSALTIRAGDDGPLIEDETRAQYPVAGERRVWVEDGSHRRLCDSDRNDAWSGDLIRIWSFDAFTEGCSAPVRAFRVCTSFVVQTARGARGAFGPFCSAPFDPTQENM